MENFISIYYLELVTRKFNLLISFESVTRKFYNFYIFELVTKEFSFS